MSCSKEEFFRTRCAHQKTYGYDKNGELIGRNDSLSGERRYRYDAVGRITGASSPNVTRAGRSQELREALARLHDREAVETALFSEESFAYDAASNLMATGTDDWSIAPREVRGSDFGGKGFGHDGAGYVRHNRLKELNGFTFSYDAFGRTVEKSHGESRRTWRYAYNSEDQLVEAAVITRSGFRKIRFTYDLLGRRIAKSDGASETRFTWSGMRLLSESRGERTSTYVYEYESYVPLARLDSWNAEHFTAQGRAVPNTPGQIYYFHCNASGMPEELTDSEGNIVWRARYAAWGKLVFENITTRAPGGFEQNLRMQGQYHDRETGLYYNTFRYYDYDTGRFTTEDPIGLFGGINLYQYAPNPLSWIDPWGWDPGVYTVCFSNGKKYHGKGGPKRMEHSAKQQVSSMKKKGENVTVTDKKHDAMPNDREAFKEESRRIQADGGPKSQNLTNVIDSPGTKYRRQDGEL